MGRRDELDELERLLETRQLVTIVGEGGIGKTRLAHELACVEAASDRSVFWVDLGAASGSAGVVTSFEDTLRPSGRDLSFEGLVVERIPTERCLLVVDNCEHVLDDVVGRIRTITDLRPEARILATSRTRLGLAGEVVWRLGPLDLPDADPAADSAYAAPSVELLVDRLRDVVGEYDVHDAGAAELAELARRTEGVPLAIELVAAAAGAVPLGKIAEALPDLRAVALVDTRREPRRHRSLDACVRWSVDRLGSTPAIAFRRLGVFVDSFGFDSAVRVISDDGGRDDRDASRAFVELVEASLVRRLADDRYALPMAVRTFAQDELARDADAPVVRDRHADVIGEAVARAAAGFRTGDDDGEPWLQMLDDELAETRAAIDWHLVSGRPGRAADVLLALYDHAFMRGRYSELVAQFRAVLAHPDLCSAEGAKAAAHASMVSLMAGRVADGFEFADRAVADADTADVRCNSHIQRSWSGFFSGRLDTATMWADVEQARRLAEDIDDQLRSFELTNRGSLLVVSRSIPEGRGLLLDAVRSGALTPAHRVLSARLFALYGVSVFDLELDALLDRADELIADCSAVNHVAFESMARATAGTIMALRHEAERADHHFDEAERLTRDHDLATFENLVQRWRAFAHYRLERADAVEQTERALQLAEATANEWDAVAARWLLGLLLLRRGDDRAEGYLVAAWEGSVDPDYPFTRSRAELGLALLDLERGGFDTGLGRVHEAIRGSHVYGDLHGVAAGLDHLARFECERAAFERAARFAGAADGIHQRARVDRLPCERDLRSVVAERLSDGAGDDAAQRWITEGRALGPDDAVRLAQRSRGRRARPVDGWGSLTPTEREVADLAAAGLTNPAIAERLFMSPNTVKTHLSHVYAKIGVSGRSELAAEAVRLDLRS